MTLYQYTVLKSTVFVKKIEILKEVLVYMFTCGLNLIKERTHMLSEIRLFSVSMLNLKFNLYCL